MFYYSTNPDAMRPEEPEVIETLAPDRQKLRVSIERKGRGGKKAFKRFLRFYQSSRCI